MFQEDTILRLSPENITKSAHDCVVTPHIEDPLTPFLEEDIRLRSDRNADALRKHLDIHRKFLGLAEQQSVRKIADFFQSQVLHKHGLEMFYPVCDKRTQRVYVGINRAESMLGDEFELHVNNVCLDAHGKHFNFLFRHKGVLMRIWLQVQFNILTNPTSFLNH